MTIGEIDLIASALGLVPWKVMREAEEAVATEKVLASRPVVPLEVIDDREDEDRKDELLDFTRLAARTVSRRPAWDASRADEDAGEEPQD